MDGDRESINIDDHKIWEQRRARLKALESVVNERQLPLESKYRVYLLLCTALKEGNVDEFIGALEKYSAEERVSLFDIIGIQGPSGNSLLHVAAGIENADILQVLLNNKRRTAMANFREDTALHVAARAGRIRTAELILDWLILYRGRIEEMANDMGNTALHEAVKNRHSELISLLLSKNPTLVNQKNKVMGFLCE